MSATDLKEQLERHVNQIKVEELHNACRDNEAQTKATLIEPLFKILGYSLTDPRECKREYKADFGENRGKEPVDWAFCVNDELAFLVEAKAVGKNLPAYDEQLGDYFGKARPPVKLAILTNGLEWRFFTDLDLLNKMDTQPFLEWDVLNGAVPYEFLAILQRAEFKPEEIHKAAENLKYAKAVKNNLSRELNDPSEDLVRAIVARVHSDSKGTKAKLTKEKLAYFKELTRCAFGELISERVNERLEKAKVPIQGTTGATPARDPEEKPGVTRITWESDATPETVAMVDQLLKLIHVFAPSIELNYLKSFIGLAQDGRPNNFVAFEPQKKAVSMEVSIAKSVDLEKQMSIKAIGCTRTMYDSYRVKLLPADVKKHSQFLTDLMRKAFDARMKGTERAI